MVGWAQPQAREGHKLVLNEYPCSEERFVVFNDIPANNGKYKPEIVHSFAKGELADCGSMVAGDKDRSQLWPVKKSMDPFYQGTGKEKFYDLS